MLELTNSRARAISSKLSYLDLTAFIESSLEYWQLQRPPCCVTASPPMYSRKAMPKRCTVTIEQTEQLRRFLKALDKRTRGTPLRRLQSANDIARDIALPDEQLEQILAKAVAAGLLVQHPDNLDLVRLTDAGVPFARGEDHPSGPATR